MILAMKNYLNKLLLFRLSAIKIYIADICVMQYRPSIFRTNS